MSRPRMHRFVHGVVVVIMLSGLSSIATAIDLEVPSTVLDGASPGIVITDVTPGALVRVHALRTLEKWQNIDGQWQLAPITLHAWGAYRADDNGRIELDRTASEDGMVRGVDPLALLRNGRPAGHPLLADLPNAGLDAPTEPWNEVRVAVEQSGVIVASGTFRLTGRLTELDFEVVAEDDLHGVFARPTGDERLPVVIVLHGSEGGSVGKASGAAERFAARGYAALAINYFAREFEGIDGLRTDHADVPIETIATARDWLADRGDVDIDRIALWGHSKGAEFALLAGSTYDWIAGVIAVSPSDVVWEGYRDAGGTGASTSSWSLNAAGLPYVPLFDFIPEHDGVYRTNTERYERSRHFHADTSAAARIRVEDIEAPVLLLAGDRDEVWAAGDMSRTIVERMVAAGKRDQVNVKIYPRAGHQLSGTGTFPVFLYGVQSEDPSRKDVMAEGAASADAWRRALEFLDRTLR